MKLIAKWFCTILLLFSWPQVALASEKTLVFSMPIIPVTKSLTALDVASDFNLGSDLLGGNPKLREAMSMSIDREKLVRDILQSGVPAYNFVPSGMYQEQKQTFPDWLQITYSQRVASARQIVREYRLAHQRIPEINLKVKDDPQTYKVAFAIKIMWENIGLRVRIVKKPIREVYQDISAGNYEVARASWLADYNDPYNFLYLYGGNSTYFFGPKPMQRVDELLKQASAELDQNKREALYIDIEDANHQYNTIIPLYHFEHTFALNPKLRGIDAVPSTDLLKWAYRES